MSFTCVKRHKRLFIVDENGNSVYSPPDFIRLNNRDLLKELAEKATSKNSLNIEDIIWFESVSPRLNGKRYSGSL